MKSYKDSNEEINVDTRLKEETKQKMCKGKGASFTMRRVGPVMVCALILVTLVTALPLTAPVKEPEVLNKSMQMKESSRSTNVKGDSNQLEKKESSPFHEYLVTDQTYGDVLKKSKTGTAADVAGEWNPMNEALREKYKTLLTTMDTLLVPHDMKLMDARIGQYTWENRGPYAAMIYTFEKTNTNTRHISITIQDEKVPRCLDNINFQAGKDYRGYALSIYQKEEERAFWVVAQKDELQYEIETIGFSDIELYAMLEHMFVQ